MNKLHRAAHALPWAALAIGTTLLILRSFYSFCWSDESFYLSAAQRFWLGGVPFVEEWNTAQLYVVLLMPFYSLYRALFGSSEGVYLAARLVHAAASGIVGAFVYASLQKESRAGALAGGLLCILYSRANIGGLSYYNLSLLFAFAGAAALYRAAGQIGTAGEAADKARGTTGATSPRRVRQSGRIGAAVWCLFAGAVMALAVVCCPFFALFWAFALLPVLPRFARWRRPAVWFLLGTGISAACYLGWLLARVSLSQIFEVLPVMLSDPEANPLGLRTILMAFALPAYQFRYTLPLWGGAFVLVFWRLIIRRRPFTAHAALLPAGLALAALAAELLLSGRMLGKPHAALCLAALPLFLLLPNARRPWRCFFCFGLPGGVLAFCWQLASNTRFSGMTIGFALASVWAAMTAAAFAGWLQEALPPMGAAAPQKAGLLRTLPALCLLLCLAGPVLAAGIQRMVLVYRDDPIALCDTRLEQGPARGLYTSAENARLYHEAYEVLAALPEDAGPLYISSLLPWGYLVKDLPCGAPDSWRTPLDHVQLPDYYALNPQSFPRTVLVLRPEYGRYRSTVEGTEGNGTNANVTESWFLDQLDARGYIKTEVVCGWLYTAR